MTNSRYCPVFNPFGTYKDINGKNWWETTYPINSTFDAHQHVGTVVARPDSKDKGIVYKSQFIRKYNTIQEDTVLDKQKRSNALVNGSYDGVSGLVLTEQCPQTTTGSVATIEINNSAYYRQDIQ